MKNCNNNHPYIRNVSEEDYAVMKAEEPHIIKEVKSRLYEKGITPTERELPSFVYNQTRQIVALYFHEGIKKKNKEGEEEERKEDRRLIIKKDDVELMNTIEKKAFCAMRHLLEEGLEGRLEKEVWE